MSASRCQKTPYAKPSPPKAKPCIVCSTAVWGDASLWYLIAEANGLTAASILTAGQVLTIPAQAGALHNTSETFRPYDPNKALGDLNPTQPKPLRGR